MEVGLRDAIKASISCWSDGCVSHSKNDLNKFKTQALQLSVFAKTGKKINFVNQKITSTKDVEKIVSKLEDVLILDVRHLNGRFIVLTL